MAGKGQSQPQRLASSTKLWAGSQLLTSSSWDPGWSAWDQLPRGDTRYTWDGALVASWETEQPGLGRWLRHTVHLGPCACQAPGRLSWEGHKTHAPLSLCPMRSAWEHEREHLRTGKCTKCRAHFGQYPYRTTWSLSSVDMESTCCCELGQTQCGPYTVSTPRTCQWYLLAVFLLPHNITEQVSLNKWLPLPLFVRAEIRH